MKRAATLLILLLAFGALMFATANAGHEHFVYIDATDTCQYIGSGQTSISDPEHGGYHRIHNNVHTGTPGMDTNGNDVDRDINEGLYSCTARHPGD